MENNEDKVLFEFLDEAFFNINSFETSLLDLEKNVSDDNTIASMYRSLHTIKGALGFFSFKNLESLVHKTEDIFNHLQKIDQDELENLSFKKDLINLFFKVNDQIKNRLYSVKNKKTDDAKLDGQLIDELSKFNQFFLNHKKSNENKETKPKLSTLQQKVLEQLKQKSNDTNKINDNIELDENIIIRLKTLETLSDLSSELILSRNRFQSMLLSDINIHNRFQAAFHNIDSLTQRISENIMKIRMQPISVITDKLKRVVRDLAASTGKEVELIIEGDKIEIDRTILEALKNPVIHIIRNAIDHGIENPAERIKLKKNSCGQIHIKAHYAENHIIIKIIDDGKGIDLDAIKEKALEKKLIRTQDLNNIDEKAILNLIFHPGFSTKDSVTSLSGRGIGMDVVKSNLLEVNGNIDIKTEKNQGTELIIKLPLTLALAAAVIVEIDELKYAISSNNIKELGCVFYKDIENKNYFEIREEKYPVIFADTVLNNYEKKKNIKKSPQDTVEYLLVEINKTRFILVVDKILDLKDMLIKALPEKVQDIDYYSGATILPDGKVALILELEALYRNYQTGASCINKNIQINNSPTKKDNPKKLITFTLGDYYCGIDKNSIKEVIANRVTTPVPGANNLSLVNIRDQVFLVKKLKKTTRLKPKDSKFTVHIVVNHGNESTGLEVDDINETIKFDEDWELAKNTNETLAKFCTGVYQVKDKTLYMLDELKCVN